MLEKNQFLIFNHVLSELYRCRTYQDLGDAFLPMLRMLIPYRYASIMRRAEAGPSIHLVDPLCVPAAFAEAERRYMRFAADDYTAWLSCCREATLFRESDLVGEQQRLRSTIYQECYQPFEVYDSLQYGIVCNGQPLGALLPGGRAFLRPRALPAPVRGHAPQPADGRSAGGPPPCGRVP